MKQALTTSSDDNDPNKGNVTSLDDVPLQHIASSTDVPLDSGTLDLNTLSLEEEEEINQFPNQLTDPEHNDKHESSLNYQRLKLQIISGGILGLVICLIIGSVFIIVFYHIGADLWSLSEHYYEGILSIVASLIISVMGLFFLRIGRLREKFRVKLATIIYSNQGEMLKKNNTNEAISFSSRYAFFILPFITSLREGLEAIVFIGGVGIDQPLSSIPLSMLTAFTLSSIFGYYFYKYSSSLSLKLCLVITTCFLYFIASGLFSKGIWQLELQDYVNKCNGQDMTEVGSGPGSYDISKSIWHVNCCNGETDGGWMLFTAIFGWTNSATVGSVISYNLYWITFIIILNILMIEEKIGYLPFLPINWQRKRIEKRISIAKSSLQLRQDQNELILENGSPNERYSKDSTTPLILKKLNPQQEINYDSSLH